MDAPAKIGIITKPREPRASQLAAEIAAWAADHEINLFVNDRVKDLPPGQKGVHIHEVGKCEGPQFTSAGGHFNPDKKQHGTLNPQGAHAGDLPNISVDGYGVGQLETTTNRITLGAGPTSVFDADGSAIVIHAAADDFKTDPTGNSGGRSVCGVIVKKGS